MMGTGTSRLGDYVKLTSDQRALVKQVWIGVENNPQFHGSVFFMGFCEIYPQYIRYFTTEPGIPLNFDSRTNSKFTVIMETMGYLLLDFHDKPKQLDRTIGYVAMIHKDMNLERLDMLNFGQSLLEYLSVTFPMAMTPECLDVTSKYMNNLLNALAQKIENFKRNDILKNYDRSEMKKRSCGQWLLRRNNLIYGRTLNYWRERKIKWDDRLSDWNTNETTVVDQIRTSSTDEEDVVAKSKTEDETSEFAESTAKLLESHGIPRKTKIYVTSEKTRVASSLNASEASSNRRSTNPEIRRLSHRSKINDNAVNDETDSALQKKFVLTLTARERRRSSLAQQSRSEIAIANSKITKNTFGNVERSATIDNERQRQFEYSRSSFFESEEIDSPARRRRRLIQEKISRSHSPSVYF